MLLALIRLFNKVIFVRNSRVLFSDFGIFSSHCILSGSLQNSELTFSCRTVSTPSGGYVTDISSTDVLHYINKS